MNTDAALALMTIGAVAQATGIPANTLRTWERRYGVPTPTRTEGGHRVYAASVVDHLRLVRVALDEGHRAKQVLALTAKQLSALLGHMVELPAAEGPIPAWREAMRQLNGPLFSSLLRRERSKVGALAFMTARVAPFMTWVGEAWSRGDLQIHHEHFVANHIRSVLDETWRMLAPPGRAQVVCATLPGEPHDMGVLMVAVAVASGELRPLVLPGQTPAAQIAASARTLGAGAVAISLSKYSEDQSFDLALRSLRAALPVNTSLWVGGAGSPEHVRGAFTRQSLQQLAERLPECVAEMRIDHRAE
ncbi:MAG: MerR family DNA-binding transcriptional regulator [Proteobacteria bacterium]|nr:MerR family DNA-binding transcriptional regulator [Pseudomonadota bacterium]